MCFGFDFLWRLLFALVAIIAVVAIMRIWVFPMMASVDPRIVATVNIIIWVVCAFFAIYLCMIILSCVFGGLPALRHF